MSFLEIVQAVFALDFAFLAEFVMNNLFWVFGFFAAGYFFTDKKGGILMGLSYVALILFTMDIFGMVQFSIYTATGLLFLYLTRMSVLLFLENTKDAQHLIPLGYVLAFFFTLTIAALGLI